MRYEPPPPDLMPGEEAISHIQAISECTDAEAIDQLRAAIVHRAVGARLVGMKRVPFGAAGPISTPSESMRPQMWATAEIRSNGTVRFNREGRWRYFEVIRENVLQRWPKKGKATRRTQRFSRPKLNDWYQKRVTNWPKDTRPPSINQDIDAARTELGGQIPRDSVREVRRTLGPQEWKKQGRRAQVARDIGEEIGEK